MRNLPSVGCTGREHSTCTKRGVLDAVWSDWVGESFGAVDLPKYSIETGWF